MMDLMKKHFLLLCFVILLFVLYGVNGYYLDKISDYTLYQNYELGKSWLELIGISYSTILVSGYMFNHIQLAGNKKWGMFILGFAIVYTLFILNHPYFIRDNAVKESIFLQSYLIKICPVLICVMLIPLFLYKDYQYIYIISKIAFCILYGWYIYHAYIYLKQDLVTVFDYNPIWLRNLLILLSVLISASFGLKQKTKKIIALEMIINIFIFISLFIFGFKESFMIAIIFVLIPMIASSSYKFSFDGK